MGLKSMEGTKLRIMIAARKAPIHKKGELPFFLFTEDFTLDVFIDLL
jgi:hypothetical protein